MSTIDPAIHALAKGVAQATIEYVWESVHNGRKFTDLYENREAEADAMARLTMNCADEDPESEVIVLREACGGPIDG